MLKRSLGISCIVRAVLRYLHLAEREGNVLCHMGHVSFNGEVYQSLRAARDFGVQVRRVKEMHRDPFFWINPRTDDPLFFLVCHVRTFLRIFAEISGQKGHQKGDVLPLLFSLSLSSSPAWDFPDST